MNNFFYSNDFVKDNMTAEQNRADSADLKFHQTI